MSDNKAISRPIFYTGFEMDEHEFICSTPLKRKYAGTVSMSTESRSAGYGTLKIGEMSENLKFDSQRTIQRVESRSSYGTALIAPPCSFELSDEDAVAFCGFNLSDPDIDDVFEENPENSKPKSVKCKLCRKKFRNRFKLKIHNDHKHPVTMVTLVVL